VRSPQENANLSGKDAQLRVTQPAPGNGQRNMVDGPPYKQELVQRPTDLVSRRE